MAFWEMQRELAASDMHAHMRTSRSRHAQLAAISLKMVKNGHFDLKCVGVTPGMSTA